MRRASLLLVFLLVLPGCRSLMAEVGYGLGFGAEVSFPVLVHTGFGIGSFKYAGHHYEDGWREGRSDDDWEWSMAAGLLHAVRHNDDYLPFSDGDVFPDGRHWCGAIAPLAWDLIRDVEPVHSYALELKVHLFVVSFRLGFNPYYLWNR